VAPKVEVTNEGMEEAMLRTQTYSAIQHADIQTTIDRQRRSKDTQRQTETTATHSMAKWLGNLGF
jgi:ribosomal protein L17